MQDKIQKVLEMAVRAPSGDNCQPWRLVVSPPRVRLYNIPEKDTSLYNFDQKASLIAHGALLENLEIAASAFGLAVSVSLFPETRDPDWIAEVLFSENQDLASDSLFDSIPGRNTNRRPFDSRPLPAELRQALQQSSEKIDGSKIYLSRDDREKQSLAVQIAQNDRLVFENPHLHRFLFDHIRFNTQEVESSRDGMDMRSFELPLMDRLAFGVLKSWQAVQLINSFGFLSKKLTKQAEKLCLSSSAIAMVTVNGDSASDFVRGGQAMERLWLEATHQGLQRLNFQQRTSTPSARLKTNCGKPSAAAKKPLRCCSELATRPPGQRFLCANRCPRLPKSRIELALNQNGYCSCRGEPLMLSV